MDKIEAPTQKQLEQLKDDIMSGLVMIVEAEHYHQLEADKKRLREALERARWAYKKSIAECHAEMPEENEKWLKAFAEEQTTSADSFMVWIIDQALKGEP